MSNGVVPTHCCRITGPDCPPGPEDEFTPKEFKQRKIKCGQYERVTISHLENPGEFYVHLARNETIFQKFEDQHVEGVYDVADPVTPRVPSNKLFTASPQQPYPCVARWKQDKHWYRASVTRSFGNDCYAVQFVDYGNSRVIQGVDIKPLLISPELINTPVFAVPCKLDGLLPVSDEWSNDALMLFKHFIAESKSETYCNFISKPDGDITWSVEIKNGRGDKLTERLFTAKHVIAAGQRLTRSNGKLTLEHRTGSGVKKTKITPPCEAPVAHGLVNGDVSSIEVKPKKHSVHDRLHRPILPEASNQRSVKHSPASGRLLIVAQPDGRSSVPSLQSNGGGVGHAEFGSSKQPWWKWTKMKTKVGNRVKGNDNRQTVSNISQQSECPELQGLATGLLLLKQRHSVTNGRIEQVPNRVCGLGGSTGPQQKTSKLGSPPTEQQLFQTLIATAITTRTVLETGLQILKQRQSNSNPINLRTTRTKAGIFVTDDKLVLDLILATRTTQDGLETGLETLRQPPSATKDPKELATRGLVVAAEMAQGGLKTAMKLLQQRVPGPMQNRQNSAHLDTGEHEASSNTGTSDPEHRFVQDLIVSAERTNAGLKGGLLILNRRCSSMKGASKQRVQNEKCSTIPNNNSHDNSRVDTGIAPHLTVAVNPVRTGLPLSPQLRHNDPSSRSNDPEKTFLSRSEKEFFKQQMLQTSQQQVSRISESSIPSNDPCSATNTASPCVQSSDHQDDIGLKLSASAQTTVETQTRGVSTNISAVASAWTSMLGATKPPNGEKPAATVHQTVELLPTKVCKFDKRSTESDNTNSNVADVGSKWAAMLSFNSRPPTCRTPEATVHETAKQVPTLQVDERRMATTNPTVVDVASECATMLSSSSRPSTCGILEAIVHETAKQVPTTVRHLDERCMATTNQTVADVSSKCATILNNVSAPTIYTKRHAKVHETVKRVPTTMREVAERRTLSHEQRINQPPVVVDELNQPWLTAETSEAHKNTNEKDNISSQIPACHSVQLSVHAPAQSVPLESQSNSKNINSGHTKALILETPSSSNLAAPVPQITKAPGRLTSSVSMPPGTVPSPRLLSLNELKIVLPIVDSQQPVTNTNAVASCATITRSHTKLGSTYLAPSVAVPSLTVPSLMYHPPTENATVVPTPHVISVRTQNTANLQTSVFQRVASRVQQSCGDLLQTEQLHGSPQFQADNKTRVSSSKPVQPKRTSTKRKRLSPCSTGQTPSQLVVQNPTHSSQHNPDAILNTCVPEKVVSTSNALLENPNMPAITTLSTSPTEAIINNEICIDCNISSELEPGEIRSDSQSPASPHASFLGPANHRSASQSPPSEHDLMNSTSDHDYAKNDTMSHRSNIQKPVSNRGNSDTHMKNSVAPAFHVSSTREINTFSQPQNTVSDRGNSMIRRPEPLSLLSSCLSSAYNNMSNRSKLPYPTSDNGNAKSSMATQVKPRSPISFRVKANKFMSNRSTTQNQVSDNGNSKRPVKQRSMRRSPISFHDNLNNQKSHGYKSQNTGGDSGRSRTNHRPNPQSLVNKHGNVKYHTSHLSMSPSPHSVRSNSKSPLSHMSLNCPQPKSQSQVSDHGESESSMRHRNNTPSPMNEHDDDTSSISHPSMVVSSDDTTSSGSHPSMIVSPLKNPHQSPSPGRDQSFSWSPMSRRSSFVSPFGDLYTSQSPVFSPASNSQISCNDRGNSKSPTSDESPNGSGLQNQDDSDHFSCQSPGSDRYIVISSLSHRRSQSRSTVSDHDNSRSPTTIPGPFSPRYLANVNSCSTLYDPFDEDSRATVSNTSTSRSPSGDYLVPLSRLSDRCEPRSPVNDSPESQSQRSQVDAGNSSRSSSVAVDSHNSEVTTFNHRVQPVSASIGEVAAVNRSRGSSVSVESHDIDITAPNHQVQSVSAKINGDQVLALNPSRDSSVSVESHNIDVSARNHQVQPVYAQINGDQVTAVNHSRGSSVSVESHNIDVTARNHQVHPVYAQINGDQVPAVNYSRGSSVSVESHNIDVTALNRQVQAVSAQINGDQVPAVNHSRGSSVSVESHNIDVTARNHQVQPVSAQINGDQAPAVNHSRGSSASVETHNSDVTALNHQVQPVSAQFNGDQVPAVNYSRGSSVSVESHNIDVTAGNHQVQPVSAQINGDQAPAVNHSRGSCASVETHNSDVTALNHQVQPVSAQFNGDQVTAVNHSLGSSVSVESHNVDVTARNHQVQPVSTQINGDQVPALNHSRGSSASVETHNINVTALNHQVQPVSAQFNGDQVPALNHSRGSSASVESHNSDVTALNHQVQPVSAQFNGDQVTAVNHSRGSSASVESHNSDVTAFNHQVEPVSAQIIGDQVTAVNHSRDSSASVECHNSDVTALNHQVQPVSAQINGAQVPAVNPSPGSSVSVLNHNSDVTAVNDGVQSAPVQIIGDEVVDLNQGSESAVLVDSDSEEVTILSPELQRVTSQANESGLTLPALRDVTSQANGRELTGLSVIATAYSATSQSPLYNCPEHERPSSYRSRSPISSRSISSASHHSMSRSPVNHRSSQQSHRYRSNSRQRRYRSNSRIPASYRSKSGKRSHHSKSRRRKSHKSRSSKHKRRRYDSISRKRSHPSKSRSPVSSRSRSRSLTSHRSQSNCQSRSGSRSPISHSSKSRKRNRRSRPVDGSNVQRRNYRKRHRCDESTSEELEDYADHLLQMSLEDSTMQSENGPIDTLSTERPENNSRPTDNIDHNNNLNAEQISNADSSPVLLNAISEPTTSSEIPVVLSPYVDFELCLTDLIGNLGRENNAIWSAKLKALISVEEQSQRDAQMELASMEQLMDLLAAKQERGLQKQRSVTQLLTLCDSMKNSNVASPIHPNSN